MGDRSLSAHRASVGAIEIEQSEPSKWNVALLSRPLVRADQLAFVVRLAIC